jgi:hypothetical protein
MPGTQTDTECRGHVLVTQLQQMSIGTSSCYAWNTHVPSLGKLRLGQAWCWLLSMGFLDIS